MRTFLTIALRNIARNKRRTLVTMASIAVGVGSILILDAYGRGFVELMTDSVVKGSTGAIVVYKSGYMKGRSGNPVDMAFKLPAESEGLIRGIKGVLATTPRVSFLGLISNGRNQTIFAARALDLESESKVCPGYRKQIAAGGEPLSVGDTTHILIGEELAHSLEAVPVAMKQAQGSGANTDMLTLAATSPEGRQNSLDVRVKGLIHSTFGMESKRFITVPMNLAESLLGLSGRITELGVAIDTLDHLDSIKAEIKKILGSQFEVLDWQEASPFVRDALANEGFIISSVSLVLFIVVVFGVVNTMMMTVNERVREIGTMVAVGVRRAQIITVFVLEGLAVALAGASAGIALGAIGLQILLAFGLGFSGIVVGWTGNTHVEVSLLFALKVILVTVIGAVMASYYPAVRAARLDPVEALRST